MSDSPHLSVLLEESVQALAVEPSGTYIDGTFGRIDRDPEAIATARALEESDARFRAVQAPFSDIANAAAGAGVLGTVQGILLDLGVSSPQLDTPGRGFSFTADGPLDMRMDPNRGESAAAWLARADQGEIARVLRDLGEERFAGRIARAVVSARTDAPIDSTLRLAGIVARAVPTREPGKHPATRTFQALRIRVNDELGEIQRCLDQVCGLLACAGRLVVISFHSLEDRIVKRFMRREALGPALPKRVPVRASEVRGRLRIVGKPIRPSQAEVQANPRARSAVLRVAERLP
ncbi:MAG: rRNA ((1402)-N(4))-methyltransferase [Chromatiaceae bacterium]|nr:rRNA ((1402)-N(4))-methyltransferase [Chromatiaceae bacterium]